MLAIGSRFFGKYSQEDFPRLEKFVRAAVIHGNVYIAIDTDRDRTNALQYVNEFRDDCSDNPIEGFSVSPWFKFVPALNALVYKAATAGAEYLLMASVEFPPEDKWIGKLLKYMDPKTLVVGVKFAEHEFQEGVVSGTGASVPWNTFAIWNLSFLSKLGFILVGDAPFNPSIAGIEELTTIALYQKLFRYSKAKLVSISDFPQEWNTDGWSEEHRARHIEKMASKKTRGEIQLRYLGLNPPVVRHIKDV
jgi:hypothetical protein